VRIALLLFVATLTVAGAADAASFDCSKATRAVDRMICADAELSQSDSSLAMAYKSALAAAHSDQDRTTLRDSQRLWLAKRDARCLRMVPAAAAECLKDEYRTRIAQLGQPPSRPWYRMTLSWSLEDSALSAAHPKERDALEFPQGAFSPKGDLFAFAVNQIVSGDMDQVWLYSLADKRLVAATPSPMQDKSDITIEGFSWAGDTLYVNGTQGPHGDAQEPFVRAASMAGSREIKAMPPPQTLPGGVRDTTAAAGDELADQGDKRLEDEHFAITSRNQGHGALTLTAHDKVSKRDFTIATGTWGLGDFVFDAPRSRVIYANGNGGIDIYSLASRKTVASLPLPINTLLDVTANGGTAAFTSIGPCDAASKPAATRRQMICFVTLPK
jgi:uncharacterized protein